jgi:hypothetical protein
LRGNVVKKVMNEDQKLNDESLELNVTPTTDEETSSSNNNTPTKQHQSENGLFVYFYLNYIYCL